MNKVILYIKENYSNNNEKILFKLIEKDFDEKEYSFNNNNEYIKRNIISKLVVFNLKNETIAGKDLISFTCYNRKCDIMEYINKYWIITIYPSL